MRRHLKSKFAAGDFVFPGGKIETDDNPDDAVDWCRGLDVKDAARRLSLEAAPRTALGYWVGVIRETFEEAGIQRDLAAVDVDGREVALDAGLLERLADDADPIPERRARRSFQAQAPGRVLDVETATPVDRVVGVVVGLDLAAREHEVARRELALEVAPHEQALHPTGGTIAEEDEGRGR